ALIALLGIAVSIGLFQGAFSYFKGQEIERATARLSLYRNTLESEIRHFGHLPFLLSLDPVVAETLAGGPADILDSRLARFAQSAGLDAIYLMDHSGHTLSASNAGRTSTFKGQNYGYRPYFKAARRGELGEFYGIGATTGEPGYFYAIDVQHPENGKDGVIAIKTDLAPLQDSWQASGERILLANADGVVLLASDPDWRYRAFQPLSPDQQDRIETSRQFANEALSPLNWSVDAQNRTAEIDGESYLYLRNSDLPNAWSLHFLVPQDAARTSAWLATGIFVILAMTSVIAYQMTRAQRISAALLRSEQEEMLLRQANEKLAFEIEERRLAEQNLQRTQAELEQAGRLAALGQLASSVTHELGQPIAAMRNQLAAAELSQGDTPLNDKMRGLVARMENITKQLKFFSRKGRDQFETLDLRDIVSAAHDLLEPNVREIDATVVISAPDEALLLNGNRMRLEQVATNILRNALDALDGSEERRITVTLGQTSSDVWLEVADSGHGLGDRSLEELREPFATTRESGKGMGLGLTISAGIISDHGGSISASNGAETGAVFRVTLPREMKEVA
ncbi:MAG: ATP-binding protein, partial [Pseudomonadota bacterium]